MVPTAPLLTERPLGCHSIWNESPCDGTYVKQLRQSLDGAGFHQTKIVAQDGGSQICLSMKADPALAKVVDIIGLHYPSDFGDLGECDALGKPIWASEESSSYDDLNGAACWARVVQSHYVMSGITASIMWNLVGAYYPGKPHYHCYPRLILIILILILIIIAYVLSLFSRHILVCLVDVDVSAAMEWPLLAHGSSLVSAVYRALLIAGKVCWNLYALSLIPAKSPNYPMRMCLQGDSARYAVCGDRLALPQGWLWFRPAAAGRLLHYDGRSKHNGVLIARCEKLLRSRSLHASAPADLFEGCRG